MKEEIIKILERNFGEPLSGSYGELMQLKATDELLDLINKDLLEITPNLTN